MGEKSSAIPQAESGERSKIHEGDPDPYIGIMENGDLYVARRPGDTQGNFYLDAGKWEVVAVDDKLLIVGKTYRGEDFWEFPLDVDIYDPEGNVHKFDEIAKELTG